EIFGGPETRYSPHHPVAPNVNNTGPHERKYSVARIKTR
ncbi:hypothetical protein RCH23_001954, partial [Cryobacterium sp. CAN_C3]|nr:hypothetical protein [Cryobacterium sp. CAN_C3]